MPELPEVEVIRRGLAEHVLHRTVTDVEVLHPRAIRRHVPGASDFAAQLRGAQLAAVCRRGKYLWLPLAHGSTSPAAAVVAHLGMSGQLLVVSEGAPTHLHLRVRLRLDDNTELRFVDQRTFGGLAVVPLSDDAGHAVPETVLHIARDPLDPDFDLAAVTERLRRRRTGIKRALLDQTVASGIGNIYADEALWRARLHYARPTETLNRAEVQRLFAAVAGVMSAALTEGGTSFDQLYVNVNGQSGYFDRSLEVYGRADRPCSRCGSPVRREPFMNRSSYFCPRCQPLPRRARH